MKTILQYKFMKTIYTKSEIKKELKKAFNDIEKYLEGKNNVSFMLYCGLSSETETGLKIDIYNQNVIQQNEHNAEKALRYFTSKAIGTENKTYYMKRHENPTFPRAGNIDTTIIPEIDTFNPDL